MAFPKSFSDSVLPSADVVQDANPGADSLKYRSLLKEIDNGLGVKDMEKLKYLCQDLGVAPRKFENMTRGIYLFTELEKLALITADDISLLVLLMQAINRYDLVKKLKSWSSKEGNLAHRLSAYRRLMLRISDSLSRDERDQLVFYLSGGDSPLPVAAIEESKSLLQLFVLMEKYTLIGPGDLEYFAKIMQSIGNFAIVKEIEKYYASEKSSVQTMHHGGGGEYNTGNRGNTRSNSAPTLEGYNQNPPWYGGQGFHGIPPPQHHQPHQQPQQQAYYTYAPQYPQTQQQATPSYNQQYPQQAIKREPEDRTGSTTSSLTVGFERPPWYYEAVQKCGPAYADDLWDKLVQKMREDEVRKKMREMKISEQKRALESTPSDTPSSPPTIKTEPEGEEREASVTRDLRLGAIEDPTSTTESQQSSTPSDEGHRIVPAQTATVMSRPKTDAGHMPDLPKYKMDRLPRGLCIIFNAENFTKTGKVKLEKRDGTEKDVQSLLNTFQNRLKFRTHVKKDPSARDYISCLKQIADMDHSEYDCFVCIILSHGCKGYVYGTDAKIVAIDALTGMFRGEYVPSLVNKPKLFFIQACQGRDAQDSVDIRQDASTTLPNESDTLVSLSTVPGYASNRSLSQGTWFISSLCNVVNAYYKQKVDLLSMLTLVNQYLSSGEDREKKKQIGNPSHTLRKQIFFNEGLDE